MIGMTDTTGSRMADAQRFLVVGRSGIDTGVMSQDEINEYADRLQQRLPKHVRRQPFKYLMLFCFAMLVVAGIGVSIAAGRWGDQGAVAVFSFSFMLGWLAMSFIPSWIFDSARRQWLAAYLVEIGYEDRLQEKRLAQEVAGNGRSNGSDSDISNPYWFTGEYNPARYYSFSKTERDTARSYGMDADEWEANRPD